MSSLKTFLTILLILPLPTHAAENPLVSVFASCTGRLSAELQHAWLLNDPDAKIIEHRRAQFIDLIQAVTPPEQLRHSLNLRIDAKMAHAELLTVADFSNDSDRSEWAMRRAKFEIDYCAGFLLES
jgi:hypothetical protein